MRFITLLLLLPLVFSLRLCVPNERKFIWYFTSEDNCTEYGKVDVKFDNKTFETGWSFLEIKTLEKGILTSDKGFWFGFAEGYITKTLIDQYKKNMIDPLCEDAEEFCSKLFDFLEKNMAWMLESGYFEKFTPDNEHIWVQVRQLQGMIYGYDGKLVDFRNYREFVTHPVYLMQIFGDLEDLKEKFHYPKEKVRKSRSHCSALVKVLPDQSDILFSHITWTSYASMLRMQKKYIFEEDSNEITFSGYPGVITSIDDFVLTSSKLAILETTITNHNESLWDKITPEGLLYFYRAQVGHSGHISPLQAAHLQAKTGKEWTNIFSKYNGGTYNNQWMVVDYKVFKKWQKIQKPGLFTMLEQMPGLVVIDDMTEKLMKRNFWPGYNRAYFPQIIAVSEAPKMVKKFGNWYSYNKAPRALIFERDQHKVVDMDSMMILMRSNNYTKDPLSHCNCDPPYSAESAIAARSELNKKDGRYPIEDLGFMDQGATDVKITNSSLIEKMRFMAIAGPPGGGRFGNDLPEFNWETSILKDSVPHHGQPLTWRFDPVIYDWTF